MWWMWLILHTHYGLHQSVAALFGETHVSPINESSPGTTLQEDYSRSDGFLSSPLEDSSWDHQSAANGDWEQEPVYFNPENVGEKPAHMSTWDRPAPTKPRATYADSVDYDMNEIPSCSTTEVTCGLCHCCFMADVIATSCSGPTITDVPLDIPLNVTHLVIRDTAIVTLGVDRSRSFPSSKFQRYRHLRELHLLDNKRIVAIELGAFSFLQTDIRTLMISGSPELTTMEAGVLGQFNKLTTLKVLHTGLRQPPNWFFFQSGQASLVSVELRYNCFEELKPGAFPGVFETGTLTLTNNNRLGTIRNFTFNGSDIGHLDLSNNHKLHTLEAYAFVNIRSFFSLDLSSTGIHQLPPAGLQSVENLILESIPRLTTFLSVFHLRSIKSARLTYQHHCCAFSLPEKQDHMAYMRFLEEMEQECTASSVTLVEATTASSTFGNDGEKHRNPRNVNDEPQALPRDTKPTIPDKGVWSRTTIYPNRSYLQKVACGSLVLVLKNTSCMPVPDAFNPCEDVLGYSWLRIICWFIVITAILGNLAVIAVTLGNQTTMNVSKLLISNLAFSDLILGIYLAILAVLDMYSKSMYFTIAVRWQVNGGCQVAGFLAVFATCLSVYTLTVITIERWYAIRNALYSNKRLRLRVASLAMSCGWFYALLMATLPLCGVSSYSKTSVCLPMETTNNEDLGYVVTLMITNSMFFVVICVCYIDIYRRVHTESTPAGQSDVHVAKRMALLVITDFCCLFPIVFFGITAALGIPLISVSNSKILLVICFPLNSCANPFLYAIKTKHFRRDLLEILSHYGYCEQRAAKFRLALVSNPVSYSQSRGSIAGITQNQVQPQSVTSSSCLMEHTNRMSKSLDRLDHTCMPPNLIKQMTEETDQF